jgi:hypothetical protein
MKTPYKHEPAAVAAASRTFCDARSISALPPKADICSALTHVCFGPIADISTLLKQLDVLVIT